ncbi:retropepsin-like aspartic protease [Pedobacter foliorum]|uniref:retropepsin-like aspartic protease n=1 Tax=Pedobacter foliorum TaxID=2739058 RepID=UPI0015664679|nr:retropepsin-like aspartic protease [Pedobacter foliorum]NRF39816.1 retropepsin-like domain-containing protein [Pedobacter foliorum]
MRPISIPLILISLQDDGFHLLVEIVVFGQKLFAVVDTGASRSVFDKTFLKDHLKDLEHSEETQATTLFSTSSTLQAVIPAIKIGRLALKNYETVALDLEAVNQAYEGLGHPPIIGIIGSDLLLKYQAVINYKKMKLYLYK